MMQRALKVEKNTLTYVLSRLYVYIYMYMNMVKEMKRYPKLLYYRAVRERERERHRRDKYREW